MLACESITCRRLRLPRVTWSLRGGESREGSLAKPQQSRVQSQRLWLPEESRRDSKRW